MWTRAIIKGQIWLLKNKKRKWLLFGMIGLGLILLIGFFIFNIDTTNKYYYIDMNGVRGVADQCKVDKGNLICNDGLRTILVQQFWKGGIK